MKWVYFKNLVKLIYRTVWGKTLWNYREYRKFPKDSNYRGMFRLSTADQFAIVVQGPVISESDFTIETLALYRNNFPTAILILSTWQMSVRTQSVLKSIDVHIIQNEGPENPGISNTNLQVVTARAGIRAAKELGAKYVVKTRTDQRIYHPSLDAYLFSLVEAFPLLGNFPQQKKRLVGISLGNLKYRMYGVADMFLFGHIDDMLLYWDIPLDERQDCFTERQKAGNTWRQHAKWRVCEVYFCTEFLKRLGRQIEFTLDDSFDVLGKHFVIIDKDAIRIYWHKYTLNADRYANDDLFDPEVTFNDWLMLYNSPGVVVADESILDNTID